MKKVYIICLLLFCSFTGITQNIDYSKFEGKPVKVNFFVQLDESAVFNYTDTLQAKITKKIIDNLPEKSIAENDTIFPKAESDTLKANNFIWLISNVSFNYQGKETVIVRYKTFENGILSQPKTVLSHRVNENWTKFADSYLKSIQSVFQKLSLNIFFEFYNAENNPSYPDINALKPLVKDADGTLNIFKLATIIEKNRSSLSKYLDE
jgi:hypothetical protein